MTKALTVYKASAGSGKTFTLATEYIKLLVLNPNSYRNILAVTFTNKATEEMKMRILSQLYGIWKQLPESDSYLHHIMQKTQMPENLVRQRAGESLHLLLHNYSYFRVETIDTFFQSVLRNLARELDLTANLRIGLNDSQVEELAVDRLIDSLTHTDVMLQWLLNYIMENISDDRSWNIIGQVKQFGKTIFRDYYKEKSIELNCLLEGGDFLQNYMEQMRQIRHDAGERMKVIAESFFDSIEGEGLTVDDFSYGTSGVAGFFIKLRNGQLGEDIVGKRVTDCMVEASKWYAKKHERAELIHSLAKESLIPILRYAVEERPRQWRLYKSADLTLRHLNQLRLLGSIEQKVRQMNEEANRFLLSDTQQLLHSLVKDTDSPFIFEKIGTQLEHVMIDEFQDTSSVQWQNFKVLLQECMSHVDTENLIVGDVKQSIYRWRSGDWRLLNTIDKEFANAGKVLEIRPLDTNYRSCRRIIEFNNAFFTEAAQQEYIVQCEDYPEGAEQLRHAYEDVVQQVPESRPAEGYIRIRLLPQSDYHENTLAEMVEAAGQLLERGVQPRDIAVLVRTNNVIPFIADYFATHLPDISIVSDEAFRLDASESVTLLVQALHLLTHPDDMLARAIVAKYYQRFVLGNEAAESELFIKGRPTDELLPDDFTQHTSELLQMPLYELTERLYKIFQLDKIHEQSAYVCAFYDQLSQFAQENSAGIDAFVREWDETICAKTIQTAATDGIRILSIHKSKGLEFDHVIIPFCDWRMEHADILWCQPQEEPFNALPIAPIDYIGKQMRGTIYEPNYLDEHLQLTVDNLNLLYVAFTRAAKSLFVIGRRDSKASRSALIQSVLPEIRIDGAELEGVEDKLFPITFTYGSLQDYSESQRAEGKAQTRNVFLQSVVPQSFFVETFDAKTEFRQSNRSCEFVTGDDERQELSYIKIGSVLHEVFSTIRTTADIDIALSQLQQDGILYNQEVSREKVTDLLNRCLRNPRVCDWFSGRWRLFNECTILRLDQHGHVEERRPDRVMTDGRETHVVDFKFGRPHAEYHKQVAEYMQLLRQMGMPGVKGWLWYVYNNKIEEVVYE